MAILILIPALLLAFLVSSYYSIRSIRARSGARKIGLSLGATLLFAIGTTCASLYYVGFLGDNFRTVHVNECYRSAQLSPESLTRHVQENGIKTVVNLRGDSKSVWHAGETEALQKLGVTMESIGLDTERLPRPDRLVRLIDCLQTAQRPILLHCNHGVDRTGVAAVLFESIIKNRPLEAAIAEENSLLTGHIPTPNNDAGERFFELYRSTKADLSLDEWSRKVYPGLYAEQLSADKSLAAGEKSWFNRPARWGPLVMTPFKALGILGASLFACRWFVQAYYSRRAGRPVTPLNFWLISILGSMLMLVYFTFSPKQDIVGIISNLFPAAVAAYNVFLELRFRARERLLKESQRVAASSPSVG